MQSSTDDFERALGAIAARVFDSAPRAPDVHAVPRTMAIAYSGGLDSSVLLHLAHDYAARHGIVLVAFHIHHGLSAQADAWLDHCAQRTGELDIVFDVRRVAVTGAGEDGIESAARSARYAALGALCRQHRVPLLLTAHHQDDQAETVLLQLLRGSGVAGLSGMDQANHAPALLGDAQLLMGRPLLALARAALEEIAQVRSITHVDDDSNQDPRYARNALRHRVMPALAAEFPGFAQRFARTARHAQSAQRLLVELAAQDLKLCSDDDAIDIDRLRGLSADRSDNLLRYWFGVRGMRMPSTAWLHEMRSQLLGAKADAQVLVGHADCDIHRHRNRIVMTPRIAVPENEPQAFVWQGEPQIRFADFGGTLCFRPAAAGQGVDAAWLRAQSLTLRWRSGGWRLKLAPNRSTRSLKYHYQDADVPAWERFRLPLVTLGKQLIYAAGLGMDCHHFSTAEGDTISLRWEPDSL
ncbi:MAG: tRNA lysidine(34) synthetase TilS [Herminiimonas sp.]|nr:tRNA lysidine(34) synthetase TilS [Herminiimonas sp.]